MVFQKNIQQKKKIQKYFYDFVASYKIQILFFDWFEMYYVSGNHIAYPFAKHACLITFINKTHV